MPKGLHRPDTNTARQCCEASGINTKQSSHTISAQFSGPGDNDTPTNLIFSSWSAICCPREFYPLYSRREDEAIWQVLLRLVECPMLTAVGPTSRVAGRMRWRSLLGLSLSQGTRVEGWLGRLPVEHKLASAGALVHALAVPSRAHLSPLT